VATFFTSSIFSGLVTYVLTTPTDCSGVLSGKDCTNALGFALSSKNDAVVIATITGFVLGGFALLAQSAWQDWKTRDQQL
jgi:hypothetical protein